MPETSRFNYIITIHNKEDMIERVLMCVLMCCRDNSRIYPVLDGCTDRTEKIVDRVIDSFSDVPITKIHTPDVHELRSINAGLRAANQEGLGYNIVLQDDVLLADFGLEKKVAALYEWAGSELGYVSFRLGANFTPDAAVSRVSVPYCDYVENAYGHGLKEAEVLLPGHIAYRSVPIKSPVCIPFSLVRSVGMFEEQLAPYGHDDPEFAIRLIRAGYRNAVFAVRFYSHIKWGGTRTTPHPELNNIIERNMNMIRTWHRADMADVCRGVQGSGPVAVPGMVNEIESRLAMEAWERTRRQLDTFRGDVKSGISVKIRSLVQRVRDIAT